MVKQSISEKHDHSSKPTAVDSNRTSSTSPALFTHTSTHHSRPSGVRELGSDISEGTNQSLLHGGEPCQREIGGLGESLNTDQDRPKIRDQLFEQRKFVNPMEKHGKDSAAQRHSHRQGDLQKQGGTRQKTPEQYLALKKQEAVEQVMIAFNKWLEKRLAIIAYAYEASEASEGSEGSPGSRGSAGSGGGTERSGGSARRPKRQLDGDDRDNSSNGGDEDGKDRGGNKRAKKACDEGPQLLACPFYKNDPITHGKRRSCAGPGYISIHRLKEHLYRTHMLKKYACPRCTEPFEDATDLQVHLRADEPCEKADLVDVHGIDEATEAKLKVRKKQSTSMSDEQRWKEIYLILFPRANKRAIPSPYYESTDSQTPGQIRSHLKRIRKELPKLVQRKIEKKFDNISHEVLRDLPDIIRDGLLECFKSMSKDDRSPSATPVATPRAATPILNIPTVSASDEARNISLSLWPSLLDDPLSFTNFLGGFEVPPLDFDDFTNNYHVFDRVSDSGYASTSTGRDFCCDTGM